MLREYFGKSPKEVADSFGKPASVNQADSQSPPVDATKAEQEKFNQATESMTHTYSTPEGNLVFHFNLNDQVVAITYAGNTVVPPEAREVVIADPADLDKHVGETVVIRGKLERSKVPLVLGVALSYNDIPSDELFGNQVACKGKLQKEVVTNAEPIQQRGDGTYYYLVDVAEDEPVTVTLID